MCTKSLCSTAGMKLFPFPNRDQRKHGLRLERGLSAFILHLLIYCSTTIKPRKEEIFREKIQLQPLPPFCLQPYVLCLPSRRDSGRASGF